MDYNFRRILCGTALSLAAGLLVVGHASAQGVVSLADDMPVLDSNTEESPLPAVETDKQVESVAVNDAIPDEISLPTQPQEPVPNTDNSGMIAPQPSSGVTMFDEEVDIKEEIKSPVIVSSSYETKSSTVEMNDDLGDGVLRQIDNDLFAKMSDLEKQTALLNLELRREKVKTEIEAIKSQRKKAQEEEIAKEEEKARKKIEWEQEQQRKMLEEQRKLREAEVAMDKLRQEKVLKAYKETMLEENQKWVKTSEDFYKSLAEVEKERDAMTDDFKAKLKSVAEHALKSKEDAKVAKENFDREVSQLQTQISVLKSRLETTENEKTAMSNKINPFAVGGSGLNGAAAKLSDEYAVMEIRGQGNELIAKLMNVEGKVFSIRKGTVLQSGHIIDEITQTYVRADKSGEKDYIYFAAGGVLDKEPNSAAEDSLKLSGAIKEGEAGGGSKNAFDAAKKTGAVGVLISNQGVPSLGDGMMVE